MDFKFYKGKKVLITGHTGFKGSWMCKMLVNVGAKVTGYALEPPTNPSLYEICNLSQYIESINGDIRSLDHLQQVFKRVKPEIVIHMAAQPIVRDSYKNPVYTYDVNVMGTVNVLEAIRNIDSVRSVVNVTTDKVYLNKEWIWGYRENEELKGFDPYSNSKSCSELVTYSYTNSFFSGRDIAISTARAGNVIGGGDFAKDRIVPDCLRAASVGEKIIVRNPYSIRPYQHVLEAVSVYLIIAEKQYMDSSFSGCYNVGPEDSDCRSTGELVSLFCNQWNEIMHSSISWESINNAGPYEANFLKLDCSKLKSTFAWKPHWSVETAMRKTIEWNEEFINGRDISACMDKQIEEFLKKE